MNNIFYSTSGVLAHGFQRDSADGVIVFIVMTLFTLGLFLYRKNNLIPKGLFVSNLISYVLMVICMLEFFFEVPIPEAITVAIMFPNFPTMLIFFSSGSGLGFFITAFFIEMLVIFGIIRMILFIKQKIAERKELANN